MEVLAERLTPVGVGTSRACKKNETKLWAQLVRLPLSCLHALYNNPARLCMDTSIRNWSVGCSAHQRTHPSSITTPLPGRLHLNTMPAVMGTKAVALAAYMLLCTLSLSFFEGWFPSSASSNIPAQEQPSAFGIALWGRHTRT